MSDFLYHEFITMPKRDFPIKLLKRETEHFSTGSRFHWHEQMEFFYVERGGVLLLCNGQKQWLYANDIAVVNCFQPHRSLKFLDNTFHYCIQVDLKVLSSGTWDICREKYIEPLINSNISFSPYIHKDMELVAIFKSILNEYKVKSYGYELFIKSKFTELFAVLFRNYCINKTNNVISPQQSIEFNHVAKIVAYITKNFNKSIKLQEIADINLLSIPYMCKIFKKFTGSTIIEYVNQVRCERAITLIAGDYSITDAALSVGFNDSNYFSRTFRKIYGYSPSQIIKNNIH